MRLDNELISKDDLATYFSISNLWELKERMVEIKNNLESGLKLANETESISESLRISRQLVFVTYNLNIISSYFNKKRNTIIVHSFAGDLCFN